MVEEVVELVASQDVRAGVHHGTSWEVLVIGGVFPTVQLVQNHFPDGVGPSRATLEVAVASVGHAEVHGVGPKGRVVQGGGDGGVVQEGLLLHHGELVVASYSQVGRPNAHHAVIGDVCVLFRDYSLPPHFFHPVVYGGVGPEMLIIVVPATEAFITRGPAVNDQFS